VRHTRRNPQKSLAHPVPDPEKIFKQGKTSQKGASGSGKPKKCYISLQENIVAENVQFEDIDPSIVSEEIPSGIHKAPF